MSKKIGEHYWFYTLIVLAIAVYFFTFPSGWLISDEATYVNQALALLKGEKYLTYMDPVFRQSVFYSNSSYTLGNSFWIALWTGLLGVRWAYLGSVVAIFGGILFLYKSLINSKLFLPTIMLGFLYPGTLFYAHTYMSGVPSFALSCIFIYVLITYNESKGKWFFLTFLAALSFWFRESNVLLLGGICLLNFCLRRRWFMYYAFAGILGFLPRLLTSSFVYSDPFHYVLGESFAWMNVYDNIVVYMIINIIFMPLGWFIICLYKGDFYKEIIISVVAFSALYLSYSYNAIEYSGWFNGLIIMSRFMLPVLPFYIFCLAHFLKRYKLHNILLRVFYFFTIAMIVLFQVIIHKEANIHGMISREFYKVYSKDVCLYDHSGLTNVNRYLNPMRGHLDYESDISNVTDSSYMSRLFELKNSVTLIYTSNKATKGKANLTNKMMYYVDYMKSKYVLKKSDSTFIKDGLFLVVDQFVPIE